MAKKDVIEFEGTVVENLPNAMFKVKLENDDGNSFNVRSQIISVLNKQLQDLEVREETQYEMLENKIYTPELFKKRRQKHLL